MLQVDEKLKQQMREVDQRKLHTFAMIVLGSIACFLITLVILAVVAMRLVLGWDQGPVFEL